MDRLLLTSVVVLVMLAVASSAQAVAPPAPPGCGTAVTTSHENTTPTAIPTGPAVVTSTIEVTGAGAYLTDLDLFTNLTHTYARDLDITLQSPAGTITTITTDNGDNNDNVFAGTTFDDQANPGGQVPYTTNNGVVTDHRVREQPDRHPARAGGGACRLQRREPERHLDDHDHRRPRRRRRHARELAARHPEPGRRAGGERHVVRELHADGDPHRPGGRHVDDRGRRRGRAPRGPRPAHEPHPHVRRPTSTSRSSRRPGRSPRSPPTTAAATTTSSPGPRSTTRPTPAARSPTPPTTASSPTPRT